MKTLISEIPEEKQKKRGWSVELDGKVIENVSLIKIENPNYGLLCYGFTPSGYDGWSFREIGSGGVVSVPFSIIDGRLYVGLVEQDRHNQGGRIWNLPRGFINPNEKHFEAVAREFEEEVRYCSPDKMVKPLTGEPCNPNSAFFETPGKNEGVKYFSIEVIPEQLTLDQENGGFKFRSGILEPKTKQAEQIYACRFFPWREATHVSDMFTSTGVARLVASIFIGI